MAQANSNIQLTDLDFDNIKSNLKEFLKGQNVLADADYEGSVLSVLLDVLAYNTHYNSYYLNMLANEMFLDTATKRNSVVSKAKLLGYVPKSTHSCIATINMSISGVSNNDTYLLIPKYTKFVSEQIDDKYYTFVTTEDVYKNKPVGNTSIEIKNIGLIEGEPISIRQIYYRKNNPDSRFLIPDTDVDLNTLEVRVQKSVTDTSFEYYYNAENLGYLGPESLVYFIEENNEGFYELIFGDGVLGKLLQDGNVVLMTYVVSSGIASYGAGSDNQFKLLDKLPFNSDSPVITTVDTAFGGTARESVSSIKFNAPRHYSAQGRAVTYQDYIYALNNNNFNFSFDAINVWGGQENDPPIYGQVFLCLKPSGAYTLTEAQKEVVKNKIIKPISVITVDPQIVDPDYVYLRIISNVLYDPKKTKLSPSQIQTKVREAIYDFCNSTLNSFDSTLSYPTLLYKIQTADVSIISNDGDIYIEKKFFPNLEVGTNYVLDFGCPLERGSVISGITSYPGMTFYDKSSGVTKIYGAQIEELPTALGGIDSILVSVPGYNYTTIPTIEITGDGTGANAHAVIVNGSLRSVVLDNPGNNYSYATVKVVGDGYGAEAYASIAGRYGNLRTIYYNDKQQKTIFSSDTGIVDYEKGIIYLYNFAPLEVPNSLLNRLTISANPRSTILSSSRKRLLTIDTLDSNSIVVNVTPKL